MHGWRGFPSSDNMEKRHDPERGPEAGEPADFEPRSFHFSIPIQHA
jgi:hypothetical protein